MKQNWETYYQAVEGRPPQETLLKALSIFDAEPLPGGRARGRAVSFSTKNSNDGRGGERGRGRKRKRGSRRHD
jgi:hypothetical protein